MSVAVHVGDEVVISKRKLFLATITKIWPDTYTGQNAGAVEIEYEGLFGFAIREIIDPCYIKGVKPRVKEG